MDRDSDKERNATGNAGVAAPQETARDGLQDASRRRFSRGALAGSAVLLSLGNRAAWGQPIGCMSLTTLNSFDPTTGMFVSAPSGVIRPDHNEDLAAELHRIGDPPLFTGTDGQFSVCEDPNSLDSVCLVQGTCP